jgi:GntR family transcriptional regulator, histidine utilization repressor
MSAMPMPLYERVKDHVLSHIRSGVWRPGQRVPSEHELVRALCVSRMTAHRALRELTDSGVLERVAGVGTFVADYRIAGHPLQIRNIAEEIRARGHAYRAEVVTLEHAAPSALVRERLTLAPTTHEVAHSMILHFEGERPLQIEDRYVNPQIAPGYLAVDFTRTTPYEYLMEVAPLQRVEHVVRAVAAPAHIGALLKLTAGEPALLIERTTWSQGTRASFAHLYHPGSHFELRGGFDL